MENTEETNEVSSSTSSSECHPNSENSASDIYPFPCSKGTTVILQGKLWEQEENAFILKVGWRGVPYYGKFIHFEKTDSWAPQKLQSYLQHSVGIENRESENQESENQESRIQASESKPKKVRGKSCYERKYPKTSVDSVNIIESKLRSGRGKKITSYSSCPNTPKSSDSKMNIFSRSGNDLSLDAVDKSDLKGRTPMNFSKYFRQAQDPSLSFSGQNGELKANGSLHEENQCDEVNSTRIGDNPLHGLEPGFNCTAIETNDDPTLPLSRSENNPEHLGNERVNRNLAVLSRGDDTGIPDSIPSQPSFNYREEASAICSNETSLNLSAVSSSTEIVELDTDILSVGESDIGQTAALGLVMCGVSQQTEGISATASATIDSDSASEEKVYTTLQNCKTGYLHPLIPPHTESDEKMVQISEEGCSDGGQNETQSNISEYRDGAGDPGTSSQNTLTVCKSDVSVPTRRRRSLSSLRSKSIRTVRKQ